MDGRSYGCLRTVLRTTEDEDNNDFSLNSTPYTALVTLSLLLGVTLLYLVFSPLIPPSLLWLLSGACSHALTYPTVLTIVHYDTPFYPSTLYNHYCLIFSLRATECWWRVVDDTMPEACKTPEDLRFGNATLVSNVHASYIGLYKKDLRKRIFARSLLRACSSH